MGERRSGTVTIGASSGGEGEAGAGGATAAVGTESTGAAETDAPARASATSEADASSPDCDGATGAGDGAIGSIGLIGAAGLAGLSRSLRFRAGNGLPLFRLRLRRLVLGLFLFRRRLVGCLVPHDGSLLSDSVYLI